MMVIKLIQAKEDTELQPNPSSSKTCATYAGTKTIQDLNVVPEDFAVKGRQHSEKECNTMVTKPIQAEDDTKFQLNHNCGKSSAPHVSCKARRNLNLLTEDQKEARRLRRMLANRESARQTILRRQARFKELARKAVELECENDNLKKEKEAAMKEYETLKSTNESLKAQLNLQGVTVNVEETQEGSNIVQSAPQNGFVVTSQIPVITNGKSCFLSEHENSVRMNVLGSPSYALPYTWFFPLSYHANGVPPQSLDTNNITNQSSISSFQKTVADVNKDQRFPLKMMRGEASTVFGLSATQKDARKRRNELITSAAATSSSAEENEEPVGSLLRRQMDAFTAAAARKRRKEVIKTKNFHYSRQSHVKISSI